MQALNKSYNKGNEYFRLTDLQPTGVIASFDIDGFIYDGEAVVTEVDCFVISATGTWIELKDVKAVRQLLNSSDIKQLIATKLDITHNTYIHNVEI